MATKLVGPFTKVIATVFTSVVAPVLVAWVVHDLQGEEKPPWSAVTTATRQAPKTAPVTVRVAPSVEAIGQRVIGVGRTPADAACNALRTAVERAVADQLDADTWARRGPALVEAVLQGNDLVVSWRPQSMVRQRRVRGTLYHCEVAIGLSRPVVRDRLAAAGAPTNGAGWRSAPILPK